ncbi:hypothetical protein NLJ89_g10824 [Agrocybe chaxingu]|uniref:Uncharacterized protein n=1 Tax=Agrocybe chaxingu TaxID=84603 RepID=A0A9W8JXX6_9AGAR|nr:hypothetical protein NLJ89_g10824 [Agrocybe chaxingu]
MASSEDELDCLTKLLVPEAGSSDLEGDELGMDVDHDDPIAKELLSDSHQTGKAISSTSNDAVGNEAAGLLMAAPHVPTIARSQSAGSQSPPTPSMSDTTTIVPSSSSSSAEHATGSGSGDVSTSSASPTLTLMNSSPGPSTTSTKPNSTETQTPTRVRNPFDSWKGPRYVYGRGFLPLPDTVQILARKRTVEGMEKGIQSGRASTSSSSSPPAKGRASNANNAPTPKIQDDVVNIGPPAKRMKRSKSRRSTSNTTPAKPATTSVPTASRSTSPANSSTDAVTDANPPEKLMIRIKLFPRKSGSSPTPTAVTKGPSSSRSSTPPPKPFPPKFRPPLPTRINISTSPVPSKTSMTSNVSESTKASLPSASTSSVDMQIPNLPDPDIFLQSHPAPPNTQSSTSISRRTSGPPSFSSVRPPPIPTRTSSGKPSPIPAHTSGHHSTPKSTPTPDRVIVKQSPKPEGVPPNPPNVSLAIHRGADALLSLFATENEKSVESYKTQLDLALEQVAQLRAEVERFVEVRQELEKARTEAEEAAKVREELEVAKIERAEAKKEAEEAMKQEAGWKHQAESRDREKGYWKEALDKMKADTEAQVSKAAGQTADARAEVVKLQTRIAVLEEEKKQAEGMAERINAFESQVAVLEAEKSQAQEDLRHTQDKLAEVGNTARDALSNVHDAWQELDKAQREATGAKREAEEARNREEEAAQRLEEMQAKVVEIQSGYEDAKTKLMESQNILEASQRRATDAETRVQELKDAMAKREEECSAEWATWKQKWKAVEKERLDEQTRWEEERKTWEEAQLESQAGHDALVRDKAAWDGWSEERRVVTEEREAWEKERTTLAEESSTTRKKLLGAVQAILADERRLCRDERLRLIQSFESTFPELAARAQRLEEVSSQTKAECLISVSALQQMQHVADEALARVERASEGVREAQALAKEFEAANRTLEETIDTLRAEGSKAREEVEMEKKRADTLTAKLSILEANNKELENAVVELRVWRAKEEKDASNAKVETYGLKQRIGALDKELQVATAQQDGGRASEGRGCSGKGAGTGARQARAADDPWRHA